MIFQGRTVKLRGCTPPYIYRIIACWKTESPPVLNRWHAKTTIPAAIRPWEFRTCKFFNRDSCGRLASNLWVEACELKYVVQLPSLKLTFSPSKMMVSNRNLLFQRSIFKGYVSFREGSLYSWTQSLWISTVCSCKKRTLVSQSLILVGVHAKISDIFLIPTEGLGVSTRNQV